MQVSKKLTIKGDSILAQFIAQNLDEIIKLKLNILNPEKGFIYINSDGDFKEGNTSQYSQDCVSDFGGKSQNEFSAVKDLQNKINRDAFGFDDELIFFFKTLKY